MKKFLRNGIEGHTTNWAKSIGKFDLAIVFVYKAIATALRAWKDISLDFSLAIIAHFVNNSPFLEFTQN